MKKYDYLIFDIDDTLLDFYSTFLHTQECSAQLLGIECNVEFRRLDDRCGWKAWREEGLDAGGSSADYHNRYTDYIRRHYVYLLDELGVEYDIEKLVSRYVEAFAECAEPTEPCALDVYKTLASKYRLALATNGMTEVQKKRVASILPYTYRLFASENMGVAKPMREYYDSVVSELGCQRERCLMIGDSISNDMMGAKKAGMDVCFYNPKNRPLPEDTECEYVISSLKELTDILL